MLMARQIRSGYAIAPRLLLPTKLRIGREYHYRKQKKPTANIANFGMIDINLDKDDETYGAYVLGGFVSLIFIEINASSSGEKIESVSL